MRYLYVLLLSVMLTCGLSCLNSEVFDLPFIADGSTITLDCTDRELLDQFFEQMEERNIALRDIQEDPQLRTYSLIYVNDATMILPVSCLTSFSQDEVNWTGVLTFDDGKVVNTDWVGRIDLSIDLNPLGYTPLAAQAEYEAPVAVEASLSIVGRDGPGSGIERRFEERNETGTFPILGLYPDYINTVAISFFDDRDYRLRTDTLLVATDALPESLPGIEVVTAIRELMEDGYNWVSYRGGTLPHMPFYFDAWGKIRGGFFFQEHPELADLFYDVGMERLQNGHYYCADQTTNTIYELDHFGKIVDTWPLPAGYLFHHHVQEKPDGNFLLTVSKEGSLHLNGNETKEDHIIEIDRMSKELVQEWDLRQALDEYRVAQINNLGNAVIDWAHGNAVVYDASDNSIIVSCRTQGVVKLNYDNEVQWIMGPHLGYGENRMGQDLQQFLLTPLDAAGSPITETDILEGFTPHPDFEWQWYQHAPKIMPNGNLLVFDNGDTREWTGAATYSRAVEYAIDPDERTIQQIWQYGKERGAATYSRVASDIDYLPDMDHILFCPGAFVDHGDGSFGGKIIEVDYDTQEVIFEAKLTSGAITFHRAERMPIYGN